jgi:hypothetical protein
VCSSKAEEKRSACTEVVRPTPGVCVMAAGARYALDGNINRNVLAVRDGIPGLLASYRGGRGVRMGISGFRLRVGGSASAGGLMLVLHRSEPAPRLLGRCA